MALAVMRLAKDRGHESFDENTVRELKAVVAASSLAHDMETVDAVFDLLDLNLDGRLTYMEILKKMKRPTSSLMDLIETNEALSFLLHPLKIRSTLKQIAKGTKSGVDVTKDSFRLYVASAKFSPQ